MSSMYFPYFVNFSHWKRRGSLFERALVEIGPAFGFVFQALWFKTLSCIVFVILLRIVTDPSGYQMSTV